MNNAHLIPAALFGIIGLGLVVTLLWIAVSAVLSSFSGWGEQARFRRKERQVQGIDQLVDQGNFSEALDILEKTFFFDQIRKNPELIDKILSHHLGLLGRMVAIGEHLQRSVPSLAIVEDLVETRCELMRAYTEAVAANQNLLSSRKRQVPRWALDEYKKKLDEISDRLGTNKQSLDSQLSLIFVALREEGDEEPSSSDLTIH